MARINLKNVLSKKADTLSMLPALIGSFDSNAWIEDETGRLLMGTQNVDAGFSYPVYLDEDIMGWVKGDSKGESVANLLMFLLQKEKEKN